MYMYVQESNKFSSKIKSLNLKSKFPLSICGKDKRTLLPLANERAKIIYISNLLFIPFFLRIKLIIFIKIKIIKMIFTPKI